jgi:hypothetical protein
MITNFEKITAELNEIELSILPLVIDYFSIYSKNKPIKEPEFVRIFNEKNLGVKLNGVRLRKLVNYIRANGIVPLIATSKGYYISYDKKEIETQIKSLYQRASSIKNCANGLSNFLKEDLIVSQSNQIKLNI